MTRRTTKATDLDSDPLEGLDLLGFDFETYYAKDYSLRQKTMSTSLYVRDSRFKVHCVGIYRQGSAYPEIYHDKQISKALKTIDWARTATVAHHAHFDNLILTHHFGHSPAFICDTLSMARALHSSDIRNDLNTVLRFYGLQGKLNDVLKHVKGLRDLPPELASMLGDYCRGDITNLLQLFLLMRPKFPHQELRKIDMFIRMFTEPKLLVNRRLAHKELREQIKDRKETIEAAGEDLEDLRSRETFAELLRSRGVKPPMKTKTRKKDGVRYQTYAFAKTDKAFQELKANPKVADLIEAKLAASSTIGESRAGALIARSEGKLALPIYLNYAKAHTLRTTGGDKFNPQNFPAREDDTLRRCIIAPPGYEIVVVDSSQIECRYNAWFSGETDLLQAFAEGRDVYAEMATEIYEREITKENDPQERFVGKTTVLGAGYQMSGAKYQLTLALGTMGPPVFIDLDMADTAIHAFRRKNAKIAANWRRMQNLIQSALVQGQEYDHRCIRFTAGAVQMPNGLTLRYPALRWREARNDKEFDGWVYGAGEGTTLYGGKLTENIIQSLSYIAVSGQALKIHQRYKTVMFTHDEVVFLARKREAKKALEWATEIMSIPPAWSPDIPLAAEGFHYGYYKGK